MFSPPSEETASKAVWKTDKEKEGNCKTVWKTQLQTNFFIFYIFHSHVTVQMFAHA